MYSEAVKPAKIYARQNDTTTTYNLSAINSVNQNIFSKRVYLAY